MCLVFPADIFVAMQPQKYLHWANPQNLSLMIISLGLIISKQKKNKQTKTYPPLEFSNLDLPLKEKNMKLHQKSSKYWYVQVH